jgi:isoleucyl-tRNA synthetase
VCRYKTLTGHQVHRKAGWDTHGLPVEIALEKELDFKQKSDIEVYGVAEFNKKAKDLIYHHIEMKEGWRSLTTRMGYWINLDDPYITCTNEYIESVWWALSQFHKKGLIYKGFKIVPQCPHCETPLSSHELALGYKDVRDMNLYVKFKCRAEDANILVWTTTPWTLISNVALAVHPEITYVKIRTAEHGVLYLAESRLSVIKEEYEVLGSFKGSELAGMEYEPLFNYFESDKKGWYVVTGDFVTTEDGSGVVHIAPAFGLDDYEVYRQHDLPFINAVTPGGRFIDEVTDFAGRLVKTITFSTRTEEGADPDIVYMLKRNGRVYRSSKDYEHSYPHCWRCDNPLIYYARDSWYIETTAFAKRMIELNEQINWCPPEVGSGRFGNWLEENKDWSLSRDRYWGTPLPLWVSEDGQDVICIGSVDELMEGWIDKDGTRAHPGRSELDLHKPFVDGIFFERDGKIYRRTPELIDVWFDSGSMPFAQLHYPFENREYFEKNYPADFICEGIDQTRGWFYTLHAIGSALFDRPAFKNVVVNELILDKVGQKMSKKKGNVVDPFGVIERYGADATRWYLMVNSPPWRQTMFNEADIEYILKNFFRALINTYQFFAMYANIDGYDGGDSEVPVDTRPEIDRWILTEAAALEKEYSASMEAYDLTTAARAISDFTIDQLSNWYVRRNRRRFWKGEMSDDKRSAYQTLARCLLIVTRLMSPFAPFLSEAIYQRLKKADHDAAESVHLTLLTAPGAVDLALKNRMRNAQRVVSLARFLREKAKQKTRQPLSRLIVASSHQETRDDIAAMREVILEETNIKDLQFIEGSSEIVRKTAKPNFKVIGPKHGKLAAQIAEAIRGLKSDAIDVLEQNGAVGLTVRDQEIEIVIEDVEILYEDIEGWTVGADGNIIVALDTRLTEELVDEGLARELVSSIQKIRKDAGLDVTDRISIQYATDSPRLQEAIVRMKSYIRDETLAVNVNVVSTVAGSVLMINEHACSISIEKV